MEHLEVGPIYVKPGCEEASHRDEVLGLTLLLAAGTGWCGPSVMKCGCIVSLNRDDVA